MEYIVEGKIFNLHILRISDLDKPPSLDHNQYDVMRPPYLWQPKKILMNGKYISNILDNLYS